MHIFVIFQRNEILKYMLIALISSSFRHVGKMRQVRVQQIFLQVVVAVAVEKLKWEEKKNEQRQTNALVKVQYNNMK